MSKKLLFIVAMEEECEHLKSLLLESCDIHGNLVAPFIDSYIKLHKYSADILITGIGMVNSMIAISKLSRYTNLDSYDCILNIGSVGARGKYKIGDIVNIGLVYDGDFDLTIFDYDLYEVPVLGKFLEIPDGSCTCITLSKFMSNSSYIHEFDDYVVDMELYGIKAILDSISSNIMFKSYKVVTDNTDGMSSRIDHETNLRSLSAGLCRYIYDKFVMEG